MKNYSQLNYFFPISAISFLVYSVNMTNKLYKCSLIYILLVILTNITSELYGSKKSQYCLIIGVAASLLLLFNVNYYIHGKVIPGIIIASLFSILFSVYIGIRVFKQLKERYSFVVKNLLVSIICSSIDCITMMCFFITKFSVKRVISLSLRDLYFKFSWSLVLSGVLFIILQLVPLANRYKKSRTVSLD